MILTKTGFQSERSEVQFRNMKRKRDLPDEDQNLRRKKKQKCQHFKIDLIKEVESKKGPTIKDVIMTCVEDPQTLNNCLSIEMDEETPTFKDETAQDNKPTTLLQVRLYGEEGNLNVGSPGPTSPPDTPDPSSAPCPSHTPDYLTPTLLMLIFNISLPTLDLYKDLTMLIWLYSYPQYWAWGIFLFAGVFLNFLFTCLAWWRLEPRQTKSWTWILLLLQVQDRMLPPGQIPPPCRCGPKPGQ